MELTNEHKKSHSPRGEKSSVVDKTSKEIPVKIIVDDVELNEEQLDIISGGGDPGLLPVRP
jgi:hypothetical protein